MMRKTMVVLATLVLGSSALSTTAFARGGAGGSYGAGGGLGGGGVRGDHFAGGSGGGRIAGGGYGDYGRRVGALRGGFYRYRRHDVWGHWGAYYGPMVAPI